MGKGITFPGEKQGKSYAIAQAKLSAKRVSVSTRASAGNPAISQPSMTSSTKHPGGTCGPKV